MKKIAIIIGSTRSGRQTPKAAKMVFSKINELYGDIYEVEQVDLIDYSIPYLTAKYDYLDSPHEDLKKFREKVLDSSALIVVSPEYNGSCPGVLKNCLDHFKNEYENKPVGIVTVSAGPHGGKGCFNTLKFLFWLLKSDIVDYHLQITNILDSIDNQGEDIKNVFSDNTKEFINLLSKKI